MPSRRRLWRIRWEAQWSESYARSDLFDKRRDLMNRWAEFVTAQV